MSEETVLKSSIFGGYKKQDVMQYVDSVLIQNEIREKGLTKQVEQLLRENKRMKEQLMTESNRQTKELEETKDVKTKNEFENIPIPFPAIVSKNLESKDKISVREMMELPEGTYMLSKKQGVLSLPDPSPDYHTKHKESVYSKIAATQEDFDVSSQNEELFQESIELQKQDLMKDLMEPQEEILTLKIEKLQEEVKQLSKMLEQEKHENMLLNTKLEYSKELFMQLYKVNNR